MYVCDMPLQIADSFLVYVCKSMCIDVFQKNDKSMCVYVVISQVQFIILKKIFKLEGTHTIPHILLISSSSLMKNNLRKILDHHHLKLSSLSLLQKNIFFISIQTYLTCTQTYTYIHTSICKRKENIDTISSCDAS